MTATAQDYLFAKVIGEPTADLATTYGSMEQFLLPKSGITVNFPKAYIVRPNGDTCAQDVRPDININLPLIEGEEDPHFNGR